MRPVGHLAIECRQLQQFRMRQHGGRAQHALDFEQLVNLAVPREKRVPGHDLLDQTAERPDVHLLGVHRLPQNVLRGLLPHPPRLTPTPVPLLGVLGGVGPVREVYLPPEHQIPNPHPLDVTDVNRPVNVVNVHKYILWFQITVYDLVVVQLVDSCGYLID